MIRRLLLGIAMGAITGSATVVSFFAPATVIGWCCAVLVFAGSFWVGYHRRRYGTKHLERTGGPGSSGEAP
jgi:hypothetical protein